MKGREKRSSSQSFTPQLATMAMDGPGRSQELRLDLPCGTLGFSGWVVVHCLPRHINRRLDGKWDSQELKWCSDTAQWCCK